MESFEKFGLKKPLRNAIEELGFETPTPIQSETYSVVRSGKDLVGIAQTGTGKTLAYLLPLLEDLQYSQELIPRIMILVPTRELVVQVVDTLAQLTQFMNCRVIGIYGGVNINTQRKDLSFGSDIIVATPGRIYDLALDQALSLKAVKKFVIDEVDVMLDLGFRHQLTNIMELLPTKRQNIMFSATMTDHVDELITSFFRAPEKISIAVSGTPLDNIAQSSYIVENFYTKINLLKYLLKDKEEFQKVLVFVSFKRHADRVFDEMEGEFKDEICVVHSNKSQNYRLRSIEDFEKGKNRILISTDVMARGLDLDKITHVINFDTPNFPENYMHRIGRTGRAKVEGKTILFSTEKELEWKKEIERLMSLEIPILEMPKEVTISRELLPEERPDDDMMKDHNRNLKLEERGPGFHEKKEKNKKVNLGGSYERTIKKKYKKPQTRGDKTYHKRKKRG